MTHFSHPFVYLSLSSPALRPEGTRSQSEPAAKRSRRGRRVRLSLRSNPSTSISIPCHRVCPSGLNSPYPSAPHSFPYYFQLCCRADPSIPFMSSCISIPFSRALLHVTLSILCLLGVAISRPTQNITIDVPTRTTNNAEQSSLSSCIPATWIDIANYFLFNYVAHGATVVSYPGEPLFDTLLSVVAAILFPTSGVIRSLNFIIRRPLLTAKNDLEVAARSGALCMLVRSSSWKPQQGDDIRNALIKNPGNVSEPSLRAHNTSSSNPNVKISPTYVPTYPYSRPVKLTNVFSLVPKHCGLVGLHAAVAQ